MKILDYLIRFKADTKRASDEAKKDLTSVTESVDKGSVRAGKTFREFGAQMRDEVKGILRMVPGGGIISRVMGFATSSTLGIAVGALAAIGKTIVATSKHFENLSAMIDEASVKFERFRVSAIKEIKLAVSVEGITATINSLKSKIEELNDKRMSLRNNLDDATLYERARHPFQRSEKRSELELLDSQAANAERAQYEAEVKAGNLERAEWMKERAKKAADARKAIIDALTERDKMLVERGRVSRKEFLSGMTADELRESRGGAVERLNYLSGQAVTPETNAAMANLYSTIDDLDDALQTVAEINKKQADEIWAKRDELSAGWAAFNSKIQDERIAALTPEQQLAGRRDQYRRVVQAGLNTADPEKRLELFNRAFELRAIMRPLIEAIRDQKRAAAEALAERRAKYAAGVGVEQAGESEEGIDQGRRQSMVGLGRLRGNKIPGKFKSLFGRFERSTSHFLGSDAVGGGSLPGKRSVEELTEESNKLLREIRDRTGFGKGG